MRPGALFFGVLAATACASGRGATPARGQPRPQQVVEIHDRTPGPIRVVLESDTTTFASVRTIAGQVERAAGDTIWLRVSRVVQEDGTCWQTPSAAGAVVILDGSTAVMRPVVNPMSSFAGSVAFVSLGVLAVFLIGAAVTGLAN